MLMKESSLNATSSAYRLFAAFYYVWRDYDRFISRKLVYWKMDLTVSTLMSVNRAAVYLTDTFQLVCLQSSPSKSHASLK